MNQQNLTKNTDLKQPPESPFDRFDPANEPQLEEIVAHEETPLEKVADELHMNLPEVNLPLGLKVIGFLALVAGLSSLGSIFAEIFNTDDFNLKIYILRLVGGVLFIAISYGILKRQNWATWLFGLTVILALIINWPLAILPAAIVVYMYFNRKYLYPSFIDKFFSSVSKKLGNQLK